ncbi:transglycosylase domain-containing protein [Streptomyces sp. NBC_00233]|uniref:transglycosylase domain-containing protein n=1 Tax=Streptomyces sp. NBC_00233 TaxID=2975686 RepID=UPI00224E894B|nr:transglycosylase domain-containing protein [Streptomyces sp. NBC_00233]MCX5233085.1 penicillin-binding protein [Streptomyces sp. NBC_00233]
MRLCAFGPRCRRSFRLRPKYPRPGVSGLRRWIPTWRQVLGTLSAFFVLSVSLVMIEYARTEIPKSLNTFALQQDNVYFWADGTQMARTGWVRRQDMPLAKIPPHVRWAVLAAENEDFYSDPGISVTGLARGLVKTVGEGDAQGGSTITQQYVKNVYLTQERSLTRKFSEAFMAVKLDRRMSKDRILEGYLNTSWFGRGTYGIQRAAQAYYGKDVEQLNLSEASFLACLLKGAGLYDPALSSENRERAIERWEWVLDRLVETGKISESERAEFDHFPEPLATQSFNTGRQSDYLVVLAERYVKKSANIPDRTFDLGGFQIYTTFDRKKEEELVDAVSSARRRAKEQSPAAAKHVHFGAASVTKDGRMLALYGGEDFKRQGFNDSNATTVPAGSSFFPFVYAAALEHGIRKDRSGEVGQVTPETRYNGDDGATVMTPEGPYWDRSGKKVKVHNAGRKSWGSITLQEALARSVNASFVQLGMDTGLGTVKRTAQASGLLPSSIGPQTPAMPLGVSVTPSALRMASAYSTFAAQGLHVDPYSVLRVTRNGSPVPLAGPKPQRAMHPRVAGVVEEALERAHLLRTSGSTAAGGKAAAKEGAVADDTATWFVGNRNAVSTAVVVYRMDLSRSISPLPLKGVAGSPATAAYTIWSEVMK